jgi:hypothetical protein
MKKQEHEQIKNYIDSVAKLLDCKVVRDASRGIELKRGAGFFSIGYKDVRGRNVIEVYAHKLSQILPHGEYAYSESDYEMRFEFETPEKTAESIKRRFFKGFDGWLSIAQEELSKNYEYKINTHQTEIQIADAIGLEREDRVFPFTANRTRELGIGNGSVSETGIWMSLRDLSKEKALRIIEVLKS